MKEVKYKLLTKLFKYAYFDNHFILSLSPHTHKKKQELN